MSQRENMEQIGREITEIVSEVKKNGIITMLTSPDRNTKENGNSEDKVDITNNNKDELTIEARWVDTGELLSTEEQDFCFVVNTRFFKE